MARGLKGDLKAINQGEIKASTEVWKLAFDESAFSIL